MSREQRVVHREAQQSGVKRAQAPEAGGSRDVLTSGRWARAQRMRSDGQGRAGASSAVHLPLLELLCLLMAVSIWLM